MNLLNTPATLFAPSKAVAIALELTAGDEDGWTYSAKNPTGELGPFSAVEIFDEDGEHVAFFSAN